MYVHDVNDRGKKKDRDACTKTYRIGIDIWNLNNNTQILPLKYQGDEVMLTQSRTQYRLRFPDNFCIII